MKRSESRAPAAAPARGTDSRITTALAAWFDRSARPLPWRRVDPSTGRRDPYASLVSEFMLQQTQVSRVVQKFGPFLARFPTIAALAAAREDDVLAEWSGLGYYRRAKNLHAAARELTERFAGIMPNSVEELRTLPGVGRYTAGAIVSIALGTPAPIVDGNVLRVLMRLAAHTGDQKAPETQRWAWERADSLAAAAGRRVASFNEGLMELGALVCTPASPRCDQCPLASFCVARQRGLQGEIPRPKAARAGQRILHASLLVRDAKGRLLVEQRPATGLWAGLWQAPTIESAWGERHRVEAWLTGPLARRVLGDTPQLLATFDRTLSHRRVRFEVWTILPVRGRDRRTALLTSSIGPLAGPHDRVRAWKTPSQVETLGLSVPQRRILLDTPKPTTSSTRA